MNKTEKPRIYTLDSLRGLAAMAVVLFHLISGYPAQHVVELTPFAAFITEGHAAVIFFFILSGFVLVYQYDDADFTYWRFLIQRVFRIYMPYLVAIGLCLLLRSMCTPHKNFTWISGVWSYPINISTIVQHLIMIGDYNTNALNGIIWSLVHEMRIAIIFPFLLWTLRGKVWKALLISGCLWCLSCIAIHRFLFVGFGYLNGYSYTAYYFYLFVAGGLIAKHRTCIVDCYNRFTALQKWTIVITALLVYNYAHFSGLIFNSLSVPQITRDHLSMILSDVIVAVAATCFIIAAISYGRAHWLDTQIPHFFGTISYSIYLLHVPVIAFIYFSLYHKLPDVWDLLIGLAVVITVSWLFNKYIERPSVKLARNLLKKKEN
jgi:peptidoglycan/LPS O-acetylase OafA/YrhL